MTLKGQVILERRFSSVVHPSATARSILGHLPHNRRKERILILRGRMYVRCGLAPRSVCEHEVRARRERYACGKVVSLEPIAHRGRTLRFRDRGHYQARDCERAEPVYKKCYSPYKLLHRLRILRISGESSVRSNSHFPGWARPPSIKTWTERNLS